jgi:hypothetical protein
VNAQALCQLGYADGWRALDFLEYPHLAARQAAALLDGAEVLPHGAVDDAELLEYFKGEVGGVVFHKKLREWNPAIIFITNAVSNCCTRIPCR